jgi:hypothetical protein
MESSLGKRPCRVRCVYVILRRLQKLNRQIRRREALMDLASDCFKLR